MRNHKRRYKLKFICTKHGLVVILVRRWFYGIVSMIANSIVHGGRNQSHAALCVRFATRCVNVSLLRRDVFTNEICSSREPLFLWCNVSGDVRRRKNIWKILDETRRSRCAKQPICEYRIESKTIVRSRTNLLGIETIFRLIEHRVQFSVSLIVFSRESLCLLHETVVNVQKPKSNRRSLAHGLERNRYTKCTRRWVSTKDVRTRAIIMQKRYVVNGVLARRRYYSVVSEFNISREWDRRTIDRIQRWI